MKTKSLHIIFATLLISVISISCGKKVTNIYNPGGSSANGPSNPSHNSGGSNTGGSTINPNPGPTTGGCGSDGCGGDVVSNNHVMIYNMFSSEKKLIEWITLQTISFLKMYGLVIEEDPLIDRFFSNLERKFETKHLRTKIDNNIKIKEDILKLVHDIYQTDEQNFAIRSTLITNKAGELKKYNESINSIIKRLFAFLDTPAELNQLRVANITKPLEKIRFDLRKDSSCEHTLKGQTKLTTGSASSDGTVHTICISLSDLATKTTSSDLNFIYTFFVHEISHIYGFDELDATRLQNIMNEGLQKHSAYDAKNKTSFNFVNKTETLIKDLINFLENYELFYLQDGAKPPMELLNQELNRHAVQIQIWGESHLINSLVNNNALSSTDDSDIKVQFELKSNLDILNLIPIDRSYHNLFSYLVSKKILPSPSHTSTAVYNFTSIEYSRTNHLIGNFVIDLATYKLAEIIRLPSQTVLYDLRPIVGENKASGSTDLNATDRENSPLQYPIQGDLTPLKTDTLSTILSANPLAPTAPSQQLPLPQSL